MDPTSSGQDSSEGATAFLLNARGITKSFGVTRVLRGMDFAVAAGEVHAFLGGNGAGKSTLLKIVAGILDADGGTLRYKGFDVDDAAGRMARDQSLAVVHQELAVIPHLSIAENIALPRYRHGSSLFNRAAAQRAAVDALSLIDKDFAAQSTDRLVATLSLHERQMMEIARALHSGAEILLLDEPTTNLTGQEAERLFTVLRRLVADARIGVVFVSHRMQEIRQVADVCTIIRDGQSAVHRQPVQSLSDAEIIDMMGQSIAAHDALAAAPAPSGAPSLDLRVSAEALSISGLGPEVAVGPGQILGLAGAPAGPQALIDQLIGEKRRAGIEIIHGGRPRIDRTPHEAVTRGVGFVSGDRANRGILSTLPIIDNMVASRRIAERRRLVRADEAREAAGLLAALRIKARSVWDLPSTLSGGTQQKLIIARWLNLRPQMLVLEEPTRGVDVGTKRDIYTLIRAMAEAGTTIVWWSTEQTELLELCDRILAFAPDGRATALLDRASLDEEALAAATGLAA
ncbi:MAG: sugar ABC transporter ATP-binding protein [Proteobacteria bacterium]|nr:sugar ABC transporter ATP-binding protein [Pseudomonadota bacterium]